MSLVTGGAGFVGSHLVDALIEQGDRVIIVDDMIAGSLRNIEGALRTGRATFVYIDVNQPLYELRRSFLEASRTKPIDRMFHLPLWSNWAPHVCATPSTDCPGQPGTSALVELAMEHQSRLIHVSTSWVYEDARTSSGADVKLEDGTRCCEASIAAAVAKQGLDARVVRLSNCYGPRMSKEDGPLIAELAEAGEASSLALPHGKHVSARSMIFVDDAIRLLLRAATTESPQTAPFSIGSEQADLMSLTPLNVGLAQTIAWLCDSAIAYA